MLKPRPSDDQAQAFGLAPGVSYFIVLIPSTVLGPTGEPTMAQAGPFLDIGTANAFALGKPGAMLTVTLVLHQQPFASAAAIKK